MHLPKATDWESKALKSALLTTIFALVVLLFVDGIDWLISGKWHGADHLGWFIVVFGGVFFTEAINSLHEHLKEIENAIKRGDGRYAP